MAEGTTAIYIALATALAIWATIAFYLARVGGRLQRLQHDLEQMPPGGAPPASGEPGVAPISTAFISEEER